MGKRTYLLGGSGGGISSCPSPTVMMDDSVICESPRIGMKLRNCSSHDDLSMFSASNRRISKRRKSNGGGVVFSDIDDAAVVYDESKEVISRHREEDCMGIYRANKTEGMVVSFSSEAMTTTTDVVMEDAYSIDNIEYPTAMIPITPKASRHQTCCSGGATCPCHGNSRTPDASSKGGKGRAIALRFGHSMDGYGMD